MRLIRGLHNLTPPTSASVVTIGNFDGIHLGHQQVLEQLRLAAVQHKLPGTVIIFEPQPIEFFAPGKAPKRLSRFRDAEDFVKHILVERLKIRHLVIGDDFRFGKNRRGNFQLLQDCGEQYGFAVEKTETLLIDGARVSSTRIRESILNNDFEQASRLLGRPYSLSGKVCHGQKLGRGLGFPTINIKMGDKTLIVKGIFAVSVKGIDNRVLQGVASIGTRPTINGVDTILEVFILEFDQDVYGYRVEVEFLHKIRDEQKFDSMQELKVHIEQDTVKAKQYFDQLIDSTP
jgi:riboflavin kinase/FMN adenylyltransferase